MLKDLLMDTTMLQDGEGEIVIVDAPDYGSVKVTPHEIANRMRAHKSLKDIVMYAPRFIRVFRVADIDFIENVRENLIKQLAEVEPWKGSKINIIFSDEDKRKINKLSGSDNFELLSQTPASDMSSSKLQVKFTIENKKLGTLHLKPLIQREIDIIILSGAVKKGDLITKSDLKTVKGWTSGEEENYCLEMKDALGYEVRRNMSEGSRIHLNNLVEPVLAVKGQIINVDLSNTGIQLSVKGKALQQGRRGDGIRVMNTSSGKVITAVMVGYGIARVY